MSATGHAALQERASTRLQVTLASVTCLTMAVGTLAGPALGILASVLIEEFDITRAEVGRLASMYALVGAAASPVAGRIADRIGGRRMMMVTAAGGAITFVVFALSPNYWWLMVMAGLSGIPNGTSNMGTNRMIAGLIPADQRGLVTGVKQSGVQLGRFLAGVALPPAVVAFGLTSSLLMVAAAAVAVMLIIPVFLPGDPAVAVGSERSTDAPLPRAVWWLTAYAALLGAGAGATFAFNALYAEERLGFSKQWAGLLVGMTGLVAGVTRIALSHITQTSRRFGVPLGNIALGASISLVVIAAAPTLGAWSLWLGAAAAAATLGSWNSVAMLAAMSTVTPDLVGRATGRVMLGFLAGLGVVPPLFGTAVDRWDAYEEAWLVLAGSAFVGFLVMRLWVAEEGRHDSFGDTPGREVS